MTPANTASSEEQLHPAKAVSQVTTVRAILMSSTRSNALKEIIVGLDPQRPHRAT